MFQATYPMHQGLRKSALAIFKELGGKWLRDQFVAARKKNKRPPWVVQEVWDELQRYWQSDDFKGKSVRNKSNSTTDRALHWHGGRRPAHEMWEKMVKLISNFKK